MWCITTKAYERHLVWTKMVTNDMVIRTMNSYAEDVNEKEEVVEKEPDDVPDLVDAVDVDSDDEDDDDDEDEDEDDDPESRPRQSTAVAVGAKPKEGLTLLTKVQESSWKEEAREKAINGEIAQLFEELEAAKPVMQVPKGAEVLRSHMFVVDKFKANGDFDKTEARIVANGSTQNPAAYPNKPSPTLVVHSLFTVSFFLLWERAMLWLRLISKELLCRLQWKKHGLYEDQQEDDSVYCCLVSFACQVFATGWQYAHSSIESYVWMCTGLQLMVQVA
jgi:hypothetical protein